MADDGACSPPRVPNAALETQATPVANKHRASAVGLTADKIHETSAIAVARFTKQDYVPHARRSILPGIIDDATFNTISSQNNLQTTLRKLHSLATSGKEKLRYQCTARILNIISLALCVKPEHAIIFAFSGARGRQWGSYLGIDFMPDYCAWLATKADLEAAIRDWTNVIDYPPWSAVLVVGEHKVHPEDSMAQLKSYLTTLKRYRPDLPTVHGFYVSNNQLEIASLNACGMYVSPKAAVNEATGWITHVALVYHSVSDGRDKLMEYNPFQNDFHRWDVAVGEDKLAVVPFHVGHAPGRVTFASWVVGDAVSSKEELANNFAEGDVQLFLKISWQDMAGRWTEGQLLDLAHKDEYIPGLARHRRVITRHDYTGDLPIVQNLGNPNPVPEAADEETKAQIHALNRTLDVQRVKEVVLLESIGEPLSQAQTVRELLYAWFDALTTLALLHKKGIVHRDISSANCLLRPKHYSQGKKKVMDHTPISKIIDGLAKELDFKLSAEAERLGRAYDPDTGETIFESCVLLTDLDHGAIISQMREGSTRIERTGTPMFIAVELSGSEERYSDFVNSPRHFGPLRRCLFDLASKEERFKAAVGHFGGDFVNRLDEILTREDERRLQEPGPVALPAGHPILFDVQSSFWVFLFNLARALPRESTQVKSPLYDKFCQAMLRHIVGEPVRDDQRLDLLALPNLKSLLHPDVNPALAPLFQRMSDYLFIPWHLYGDPCLPEEHSIVFFQRLILSCILSTGDAILDKPLNTERPRPTTALDDIARTTPFSSASRVATSNSQPASVASILSETPSVQAGGSGSGASDGSRKRCHQAANPVALPSVVQASDKKQKIDERTFMRLRSQVVSHDAVDVDVTGEADEAMAEEVSASLTPEASDGPMDEPDADALDDVLHSNEEAMLASDRELAGLDSDEDDSADDDPESDHDASGEYRPPRESRKSKKESVRVDDKYDEVKHLADRSALAMRLKQWKDERWYGSGK